MYFIWLPSSILYNHQTLIWDFFYRWTDRPTNKARHRSSSRELKKCTGLNNSWFLMFNLNFLLFTFYFLLFYFLLFTFYSSLYILYSLLCTLYSLLFTLYSLLFAFSFFCFLPFNFYFLLFSFCFLVCTFCKAQQASTQLKLSFALFSFSPATHLATHPVKYNSNQNQISSDLKHISHGTI